MINEDLKEKEKILERLFQAENRNFELEQTIKTLNRRISILEAQSIQQAKEPNSPSQNNCTQNNPVVVTDFSEPIRNNSNVDQPSSQNIILTPTAKSSHRDNNHSNRIQHHVDTSYTNGSEENHDQYRITPLQISQKTEIQHTGRAQIRTNPGLQQFKPYISPHQNLATSRQNCKAGQPIFYTTPNESDNHFFIQNRPKSPNQLIDAINSTKKDSQTVHSINNVDISHKTVKLLTFNCKNILTCGPFFAEATKHFDICLIQEHWLFNCQLNLLNVLNENLIGIGKSVDERDPLPPSHMPRGYGGVAIL
ncbi:unnamed protein product [Mytilus coruscus]|uniref:Endonuclease/exonuclease/phosphatase domain-containing protein n=1 Tax=Mytilus coruscus TaxID=42192 RepID=A0A6J8ENW7_MYTCO|nr:unnamed protein product [Mytilus coruscus]